MRSIINQPLLFANFSICLSLVLWTSAPVQAADVTTFGLTKGQKFSQTSDSLPVPQSGTSFFFEAFVNAADADLVQFAFLMPPSFAFKTLSPDSSGRFYTSRDQFTTESAMDASFGPGQYTFTIATENDDTTQAALSLANGALPLNPPHISNYQPAQQINPDLAFTLSWDQLVAGGPTDVVQLIVESNGGELVFATPVTGQPGALTGTSTSVAIPGGTLESGQVYNARLVYQKIASEDTTAYPGAVGLTTFSKETSFTLKTTGVGSDTTPPFLLSSSPINNATGVAIDSPVSFTFNEAMGPGSAIAWSANINPANFNCVWSADNRTLTCSPAGNLPSNSAITWTLNSGAGAGGFADQAGNPLPGNLFTGRFTTSNRTGENPCLATNAPADGGFSVFKTLSYSQTSGAAPVLEDTNAATFFLSVNAPSNRPVSSASVRLPDGNNATLSNFFGGDFFAFDTFDTRNAMEARFGSGNYRFTMNEQGGTTRTATLNLPTSEFPTTPRIESYQAGQSINPAANYTLRWDAFSGATVNDGISLVISDDNIPAVVFMAPDPCVPRDLKATDTSIVIPAGTLTSGRTYRTTLSFTKFTDTDNNSFPGAPGIAGLSKTTTFSLRTTGGATQPQEPRFTMPVSQANGVVKVRLEGEAGVTYIIEASTDLINWTTETTTTGGANFDFEDSQAVLESQRFFRAKVRP